MARIARVVHRAGGMWSIEHPERSLIWSLPAYKSLLKLKGIQHLVSDQCCFGGLYRKSTGWLTKASFLSVLACRCPGRPLHPRHPVLQGKAIAPDGRVCWLTELAAEYPEDLCNTMAEAYSKVVHLPMVPHKVAIRTGAKYDDPGAASEKVLREQANADCIGGLRDPGRSLLKLPLWYEVGAQLSGVLDGVLLAHGKEVNDMVGLIGRSDAHFHRAALAANGGGRTYLYACCQREHCEIPELCSGRQGVFSGD
jgi:hypothetical protein